NTFDITIDSMTFLGLSDEFTVKASTPLRVKANDDVNFDITYTPAGSEAFEVLTLNYVSPLDGSEVGDVIGLAGLNLKEPAVDESTCLSADFIDASPVFRGGWTMD